MLSSCAFLASKKSQSFRNLTKSPERGHPINQSRALLYGDKTYVERWKKSAAKRI